MEDISLRNIQISDNALEHIAKLENVKKLDLGKNAITNLGVHSLRKLQLSVLWLDNTLVSDDCFDTIQSFKHIESLNFSFTSVSGSKLHLLGNCEKLKELVLERAFHQVNLRQLAQFDQLNTIDLNYSISALEDEINNIFLSKKLSTLKLSGCKISWKALSEINSWSQLENLELSFVDFTDDLNPEMAERLEKLKILQLGNSNFSKNSLKNIAGIKELRFLGLSNLNIVDADLIVLEEVKQLKFINLAGNPITDYALEIIKSNLCLEDLNLSDTDIRGENFDQMNFKKSLRSFTLSRSHLTDKGLSLLTLFSNLEFLAIDSTKVSAKYIHELKNCHRLSTLMTNGVPLSNGDLIPLSSLSRLHCFDLKNTEINEDGLTNLNNFKNLQSMYLDKRQLTTKGVKILNDNNLFIELYLEGEEFSDETIIFISNLERIQEINLFYTSITIKGIKNIIQIPTLNKIRAYNNPFLSKNELANLRLKLIETKIKLEY